MRASVRVGILAAAVLLAAGVRAQGTAGQASQPAQSATAHAEEGDELRPPVAKSDIEVVKRAREILNSPAKWNRKDDRNCPDAETTYSLYCALEKATDDVTHDFAHRGAAMQEARFVIDDDLAPNNNYEHRLMNYNNDPKTTWADVQKFFDLLKARIEARLEDQGASPQQATAQVQEEDGVTQADIDIVKKVEEILDSPAKWDRKSTQKCAADAKTFGLYCAFDAASTAVTGKFDDDRPGINEARQLISKTAPNSKQYKARLVDYNNDPTVTFEDLQKLLKTVEENLEKKMQGPKP